MWNKETKERAQKRLQKYYPGLSWDAFRHSWVKEPVFPRLRAGMKPEKIVDDEVAKVVFPDGIDTVEDFVGFTEMKYKEHLTAEEDYQLHHGRMLADGTFVTLREYQELQWEHQDDGPDEEDEDNDEEWEEE